MQLTRISVYRPVVALTLACAVLLFGVASYASLGLEQNPQIDLPIVTVQVVYPGASARTVEEQVTRRVEDAIAGLGNIKTLSSISQTGLATITVEFREGVNGDTAANDVQRRVSGIRRDLPSDAEEPSYLKLDLNDVPILYLAVTSPSADATSLYRVADQQVRPRLETADGVGHVVVAGGQEPEVQVEILPEKLRAYGLSIDDVASAVRSQFVSISGGEVRSGAGAATRQATLSIDSRETSLASLGALPVQTTDGASTELRNVARIYLGGKEATELLRVNGQPAVGLLVFKQSSANITQTADAVLPLVSRIDDELPDGFQLQVAVDQSTAVRETVADVENELLLAALITGTVLFFFLHSLRSTLIVLLAIPASLLVALIVMKLAGLTLNAMSLIGLTTAIGVLVDDSIVVLENIFSHLERGTEPKRAAVDGRAEIGLAAVAITLVDVAVWGPIIFISGITGAFLKHFAIVMVAATLASLLVSFTLTPLIASRWLGANQQRSLLGRIGAFWEPLYHLGAWLYRHVLHWSLRHRPVVLVLAALVFGLNGMILPQLGTEFVPETDRESVTLVGELPAGTALEASDQVARRWEAALLDRVHFPEVQTVYVDVGRGDSDFEREPRFIAVTLGLTRPGSRQRTSMEIGKQAARAGQEAVPELRAHIGGDRAGGSGQPVQIRLFGDDLDGLTQLSRDVQARLASLPELSDVTNGVAAAPELVVRPDPRRLLDLGMSTATIGNAVRVAYQGAVVGRWADTTGKEWDVRVRLPDRLRYDPSAVGKLPLARRGESMLTLDQVASLRMEDRPSRITRVNRQRVVLIGAEPAAVPLGTAMEAVKTSLSTTTLPAGARWSFAGQGEEQQSSFDQLGKGLAISILLMYLVLTVLYESVIYPLLIITALPLATVGAFLGLLLFHQTLSVPSFIGLIALFGLVGKNSILLVDRANDLRRHGVDRTAALEQAGQSRLRPILMTSAVLILSMLPVALKLGEGGEERAPLGAVIVGGMATSTLLSLLFVPVAYTYFDSFQALLGRLFRWRPRPFGRRSAPRTSPPRSPVTVTPGSVARAVVLSSEPVRSPRRTGSHQRPAPDTLRGGLCR
ncbi:MAG: efflux RND transporter permease subunit [Chloroflexi bacterium]|nr:efflux RND transporter permease subunit [Chloroflexota bacterium]